MSSFKQQLYSQLNPEFNIQKVPVAHINFEKLNSHEKEEVNEFQKAEHLFKTCEKEMLQINLHDQVKEPEMIS